jgi:hypothetical protein
MLPSSRSRDAAPVAYALRATPAQDGRFTAQTTRATTKPAEQSPLPPYTFPRRHSKKSTKLLKLFRILQEKYLPEFGRAFKNIKTP